MLPLYTTIVNKITIRRDVRHAQNGLGHSQRRWAIHPNPVWAVSAVRESPAAAGLRTPGDRYRVPSLFGNGSGLG